VSGPRRRGAGLAFLAALVLCCGCGSESSKERTVRRLRELSADLATKRAEVLVPGAVAAMARSAPAAEERVAAARTAAAYTTLALEPASAAVTAFEAADRTARSLPPSARGKQLRLWARRGLALSFLRLGEEQNCVAFPHAGMCTLPLERHAWHTRKEGSTKAAEILRSLLEEGDDDVSRWLFNVALMTLGRYPGSVPRRWLVPPEAFRGTAVFPRFPDQALQAGLGAPSHSGGAVAEDFDGDGRLDLVTSSSGLEPADQLRFYHADGASRFEERTASAALTGLVGGLQVVATDYDNDGRPDLYVPRGAWVSYIGPQPPSLLHNEGGGVFKDVTDRAGLSRRGNSQVGVWADYDNDGLLDFFDGEESQPGGPRTPCRLYHNNGDGTFTDVAHEAGLDFTAWVKGAAWGDYDGDGRPDLLVSLQDGPVRLYHNEGPDSSGRWRFRERGREAGLSAPARAFSSWWWDYDNDGRLDIFVAEFEAQDLLADARRAIRGFLGKPSPVLGARLYRNVGGGRFEDVTAAAGLEGIYGVMGAGFGDLDNDGYPDIVLGTGSPSFAALIPNRAFHNVGGKRFEEVTYQGGFGNLQKGHGVVFADFDGDGAEDVYASFGGMIRSDSYRGSLYRNPGGGGHWIDVSLEGRRSNRPGLGAVVKAVVASGSGRERAIYNFGTLPSFGNAPMALRHLGLGKARTARLLEVYWPASGLRQTFRDVPADRSYSLREGQPLTPKGVIVRRAASIR